MAKISIKNYNPTELDFLEERIDHYENLVTYQRDRANLIGLFFAKRQLKHYQIRYSNKMASSLFHELNLLA